jgi:two-component system, OmpR family, phosphate regulon response regulator PhoB
LRHAKLTGVGRDFRVLLVSDSQDEREMYAEWFRRKGYCTLQAATASDGLRLATELAPDIVVTDIKLPGSMDGLDLTETLKQDQSTRALPVVILTGCAFERDREQANRAGCDRFLTKPCLPEVLATSIEEVLSGQRSLRGAVEGV